MYKEGRTDNLGDSSVFAILDNISIIEKMSHFFI